MSLSITILRSSVAASLLALALGACASLITGGPLIRDPNGPTGQIIIQNNSSSAVRSVLISACNASSYGLNRLPRGTGIPAGQHMAFTVSAGCWDVMAGNSNNVARRRLSVTANGQAVYTVP